VAERLLCVPQMLPDELLWSGTLMSMAKDRRDELYEKYLALPEYKRGEIIEGTLYVMSRPAPRHANASSILGGELNGAFQRGRGGPGGWWIIDEPEIHFVTKEPLSPDIAGWRVERMPALPNTAHFELAPDWVCEVLSRSTERIDRQLKLPIYARHGIQHVWLVDPIAKVLEVYALDDQKLWREVEVFEGERSVRVAPFDAIELDLSALWSAPAR
jgi:Uma2 family endonuclease